MGVDRAQLADFDAWITLAREVEPLFGPMADKVAFHDALRRAIFGKAAFCIRSAPNENDRPLKGGIVISREASAIEWFAVSAQYRSRGYGRQLLQRALGELNPHEGIWVQTFNGSVREGKAARKLYSDFGFADYQNGGLNPAGVPTVVMRLAQPDIVS